MEKWKRQSNTQNLTHWRSALVGVCVVASVGCTKKIAVKAVKVAPASVETTVTTISSGTVHAEDQAVLNFGSVGRIARVNVNAGDKVKKGQILANLENSDLQMTAQAAGSEYKRVQDLFKEGLVSQAALDEAKRAAQVAQAVLDRSVILAPFEGLITVVNLQVGELSQIPALPDNPPIRIVDLETRLVKGEVDELDLGKIKVGLPARIKIPALGNRPFTAKITNTVPFVSSTREQDRTSEIELRLEENDPAIPVGASAEVEIIIETKENVLTVPARAVFGTSKKRYVYQVIEGVLEKKTVEIGIGNYDRREITIGLNKGDVVALPGEEYEFNDGQEVNVELQAWP